jgi:hypothetical protein
VKKYEAYNMYIYEDETYKMLFENGEREVG